MPEGDTVHRLARRLAPLAGRRLTHAELRVPALATLVLRGRTIERVTAWGKSLYMDLVAVDDMDLVLHTHLRMDGTWLVNPSATAPDPGHETRVWLRVEGYPDPSAEVDLQGRTLGVVDVWPREQHARRTAHLGPDPLAADWLEPGRWERAGRDEAADRFRERGAQPLVEVLLHQWVVAGIGNVYANEMCFLLGSHPMAPASAQDPAGVVDDLVARVGPGRLCWGSDHPQDRARTYPAKLELAERATRHLDDDGRDAFFAGPARRLFFSP